MSSKTDIVADVLRTYNTYRPIFDLAKITTDQFSKWLDGFTTHDQLRKVNIYLHGGSTKKRFTKTCLLRNLIICQDAYKHFTPEQWETLLFLETGNNHRQVAVLRVVLREFKENWKNRPKSPRKSTE